MGYWMGTPGVGVRPRRASRTPDNRHDRRPNWGDAQGGFQRSALKPLLWGEPPAFGGVGGTFPAPAFPRRGKRERGRFKFLAAAGYCCLHTTAPAPPLIPCVHSKARIPFKVMFVN